MKIVVLDGYTLNPGDLSWEGLHALGDLEIYDRSAEAEIIPRAKGAAVILTNKVPIRKETIEALPDLKYIGVLATGYNIIDIETAKANGIIVTNVPGYGTASVAQMSFALILELCLHVQRHSDSVHAGRWATSPDFSFWDYPLIELSGKTMGIIGFGTIGEKTGDLATAFGMNLMGHSRTQRDMSHRKNFRWASLEELTAESDIISIHCPLTPETQGLINMEILKRMKASAFLINTSRGPIIVEEDLARALNTGVIAGAGIDVLSLEPPRADNPLFGAKNCLITPHIAWATKEARLRLLNTVISNLGSYISGDEVNVVNR